jgi:hypothetical protein
MNHKLWNIVSTERYILHMQVLLAPAVLSGVRVIRSLVLCVCYVDRGLSFFPFYFVHLCCLSVFDLRILITFLVSKTLHSKLG